MFPVYVTSMMEAGWYCVKISGSVSGICNLHDGGRVVLREDIW